MPKLIRVQCTTLCWLVAPRVSPRCRACFPTSSMGVSSPRASTLMRPLPLVLQSRYYLSSVCNTPVLLLAIQCPAVLAHSCYCSCTVKGGVCCNGWDLYKGNSLDLYVGSAISFTLKLCNSLHDTGCTLCYNCSLRGLCHSSASHSCLPSAILLENG